MSIKRIAWGVVVGVVCLFAVYCVLDWESVHRSSVHTWGCIDAYLNPDEWQLGDVRVARDENKSWDTIGYDVFSGDDHMRLAVGRNEAGETYETGYVSPYPKGYAGVLPSDKKLSEDLPLSSGIAALTAQRIANEMRQHKPWPWSLRQIAGRVKDISQRRMQLETIVGESSFVMATGVLYERDEVIRLMIAGSPVYRIYLWDNRSMATASTGTVVIERGEGGYILYADDDEDPDEFVEGIKSSIAQALSILRASPDALPGAVDRLVRTEEWLTTRDFKRLPKLERDTIKKLTEPWDVKFEGSGSSVDLLSPFEDAESRQVQIGDVSVSRPRKGISYRYLQLAKDDLRVDWHPFEGKSRLSLRTAGYPYVSITVIEDGEYPRTAARFGDEEASRTLDVLLGLAGEMLDVEEEIWPVDPWRQRLRSALTAFTEGRFSAFHYPGNASVGSRLICEGDEVWAVFSQYTSAGSAYQDYLEFKFSATGFEIYDSRAGCLLQSYNGATVLSQNRADASAGDKLHLANVSALIDFANTNAEELTQELVTTLKRAADFVARSEFPQPTLEESIDVPDWSYAAAQARIPVCRPGSSG